MGSNMLARFEIVDSETKKGIKKWGYAIVDIAFDNDRMLYDSIAGLNTAISGLQNYRDRLIKLKDHEQQTES